MIKDTPEQFQNLLKSLNELKDRPRSAKEEGAFEKSTRAISKRSCTVASALGPVILTNWRVPEFTFWKNRDTLPCLARGLFTLSERIVVRGYDKFFNMNENNSVEELVLADACVGPFNVSVKENGCIIFLAGLADSTLVVCSKNLTGTIEQKDANSANSKESHYERGMAEISQQLGRMGKTTEDLARVLYEENLTAVAELCDDSYEEHVVEYPPELSGLYLHGLNYNTIGFSTKPMDEVTDFTGKWGFRAVHQENFATFSELLEFLTLHAQTGIFQGREVEGFVIRCKKDGSDFFFKYKFEQPYLLYRQLREATYKMISPQKNRTPQEVVFTFDDFHSITYEYLEFARDYFDKNPEAETEFLANKGIIRLRSLFMDHLGYEPTQGLEFLSKESSKLSARLSLLIKTSSTVYLVSTVATPGCGKTTTCMTLAGMLEGWKHFQNDNFSNAGLFYKEVLTAMYELKVVFLDKMNYSAKYRSEIISTVAKKRKDFILPNVEIRHVAINFLHSGKNEQVFDFLKKRVIARGDNHQSVKAESEPEEVSSLLADVYDKFDPPQCKDGSSTPAVIKGNKLRGTDSDFNLWINVDCMDGSLANAKFIYQQLCKEFPDLGPEMAFTDGQWEESFQKALAYEPHFSKKVPKKKKKVVYYGIQCEGAEFLQELGEKLSNNRTWQSLAANGNLQKEFHVTLAHTQTVKQNKQLQEKWELLGRIFGYTRFRKNPSVSGKIVVTDTLSDIHIQQVVVVEDTLIALSVALGTSYKETDGVFHKRDSKLDMVNDNAHITIGTATNVRPYESNVYLGELFKSGPVEEGRYLVSTKNVEVYTFDKILEKQMGIVFF